MIVRGRTLRAGFAVTADVCVVGSGAGGAVVAKELAEAGLQVVVLEEGPYYRAEDYGRFRPTETLRRLGRDGGLTAAVGLGDSPMISLLAGRCVGGSSVLTGGVCFRIPDEVHDAWVRELGLTDLAARNFEAAYESVEREVHVETVPEHMRSRGTELFVRGAARMGIAMRPLRRNTDGCDGCARCNFGCPHGAKLSVDVSYLVHARERGAVVYADCLAERVSTRGRRATGVTGRVLNGAGGRPRDRFEVRAKVVVVAAGTLHTPLLLARSGLGQDQPVLGRNMTLHPGFRVAAVADDALHGWRGVLQSVYSDHFLHDGITLVGVYTAPSLLAAAMPGVGPKHLEFVRRLPNTATFGGMVHDEGGGTVRPGVGREPVITYRMAPRDKRNVLRGIRILGQMALEGGAREVLLPVWGSKPVTHPGQLRDLEEHPPHASRLECMAFHPLGTARMGHSRYGSVVGPSGETHEVENLFVADGSVFPTSIGVNSQLPIMTMATRIAWGIREAWRRYASRA